MPHREVIEDICADSGNDWCLLKVIMNCMGESAPDVHCSGCVAECPIKTHFLESSRMSDRTLEQLKCIEKFKWELNKNRQEDIGWDVACELWIKRGYAERFADVYRAGMKNGALYKLVMPEPPEPLRTELVRAA